MIFKFFNSQRLLTNGYSSLSKRLPVLELFTKSPCPLCDIALQEISPISDQFELLKVDITKPENRHWWKKYKYDIPVFHFEGEFLMKHKADVTFLQQAIENYKQI